MKKHLIAWIILAPVGLAGCSIPFQTGYEVTAGKPLTETQLETGLREGSERVAVLQKFGQPSWAARDQQIICYEGEFDRGTMLRAAELFATMAVTTISVGAIGAFFDDFTDYRRVLIYFEDDRLRWVRVYTGVQDDPEYSRYVHLLEFMDEVGLPCNWLMRDEVPAVLGSDPAWSSADGDLHFFGSINPHDGDVNGLFVRYDEYGLLQSYRRQHFGRMIKDYEFEIELDSIMADEAERLWAQL